ncbi:hypothetical protein QZH41_014194 [Actinostola sp. cb2023]|nr:hypothetical protein QZH41_014194 [Actinostola sp. cb2023]
MLLLLLVFQLCLLGFADAAGAGLQFSGKLDQYAEYETWDFSMNGTLSFLFQTHKRSAFLLYQDNRRNDRGQDFLDVFILNGNIRMRLNIGFCSQGSELTVRGDFSDSKWHYVTISLGYKAVSFSVDKTEKSKAVHCENPERFATLRKRRWTAMYLGGIPIFEKFSSMAWSSPTILREATTSRFDGCIGDLIYQKGNARIVKAKLKKRASAVANCDNACLGHPQSPPKCRNGGTCVDHIVTFDCDCTGTGYEGDYCANESSMVYMNGTGYFTYQILTPNIEWSMKNNRVSFRIVPLYHSGVILHLGKPSDHLVVELVEGKLQIGINLGGGQFIMRSNVTLNVSEYHFVEIVRRQRRLTLDINLGWEVQTAIIPGGLFSLDLKGAERVAYFGGGPGKCPNGLSLSTSKRNFSGFLQQFKFERIRVLDKVMYSTSDKRFSVYGEVMDGRLRTNLLPNLDQIGGSTPWCGELDDDEDMDRCPPPTARCFTPDCIFGTVTTEAETSTEPSIMTLPASGVPRGSATPGVMSIRDPLGPDHRVSPWLIIIIVAAAVVAVLITIFFLYRWNNRYTGSFKPSKSEPGEGVQPVERGYEQPAFYVSPNKPITKAEESMA